MFRRGKIGIQIKRLSFPRKIVEFSPCNSLLNFLCQNRGQNYITVAKAGHSIAFGPMPIGKPIQEQVAAIVGPEPWFVTKISNSTELAEFRGSIGREIR